MGRIFAAGGIVMWPLLVFLLVAIALIIERLIFGFRLNRRQRQIMQDILRTYRQTPVDVYAKLRQNVNLPIARIFIEALEIEGASPSSALLARVPDAPQRRPDDVVASTPHSSNPLTQTRPHARINLLDHCPVCSAELTIALQVVQHIARVTPNQHGYFSQISPDLASAGS